MRALIFLIAGIFSGYIISNLKTKKIDEILEELLTEGNYWIEVIQEFIGDTIQGLEGKDSDVIKTNIDGFIDGLNDSVEEFLLIDNFEERIRFIEDKVTLISSDLLNKTKKIERK